MVTLNIDNTVYIKSIKELGLIKAELGKETNEPNEEPWYEVMYDCGKKDHFRLSDLIPDMFEHIEELPKDVKDVLDTYEFFGEDYGTLADMHRVLGEVGYEFEYYLDATPYFLRKKDLEISL